MAQKRKATDTRPLSTYRPGIDRLIFSLALLGVVVAVHLWIQQSRGFAEGCTGFEEGAAASVFDCGAVVSSAAGTFLGVSNTIWGLLFYLAVATLTALAAVGPVRWLRPVKQARLGLVSFGLVYSGYLILYQFTQLDAWCLLCLISAAIVAALTVLVWMDYRKPAAPAPARQRTKSEGKVIAGLVIVTLVLSGADVLYFKDDIGVGGAATLTLADGTECHYDPERPPVANFDGLITAQDPYTGTADAPVTVLEFFDPNCPHCKNLHPTMQALIRDYRERVRFVFKPIPLWQHSAEQVAALYEAAEQGTFFGMAAGQFERQDPNNGLAPAQVQAIAEEIGMDVEALTQALETNEHEAYMMAQRQLLAAVNGRISVPAVLINGRVVQSKSLACLQGFIEHAEEVVQAGR